MEECTGEAEEVSPGIHDQRTRQNVNAVLNTTAAYTQELGWIVKVKMDMEC